MKWFSFFWRNRSTAAPLGTRIRAATEAEAIAAFLAHVNQPQRGIFPPPRIVAGDVVEVTAGSSWRTLVAVDGRTLNDPPPAVWR
jgi:hypothetical protein